MSVSKKNLLQNQLPSWLLAQLQLLRRKDEPAWLLHGAPGVGQFELGLALAHSLLCENKAQADLACGQCEGCLLLRVGNHPDLAMVVPEQLALDLELPLDSKMQQELVDKKRKPSQEIKVNAVRKALDFAQTTALRGGLKIVLIYPAEQMNPVTANTLLKTLEEPAPTLRFILLSQELEQLLPTIKSRCVKYSITWPDNAAIIDWLAQFCDNQAQCEAALRLVGGYPIHAQQLLQQSRDLTSLFSNWENLPQFLSRGKLPAMESFSIAQWLLSMQKLCHDLMLVAVGAEPRYFLAQSLPTAPPLLTLTQWDKWLRSQSKYVDRPYNANLFLETLIAKAQQVLSN